MQCLITTGELCGSLGKIVMARQAELQALLGGHRILLVIKKYAPIAQDSSRTLRGN